MKANNAIGFIKSTLVILFFYTALSKLLDLTEFQRQLSNQTLPRWSVGLLLWLIPLTELLVCFFLILPSTQMIGFCGSTLLMILFTGYIGLVLLNVFDRVPCSCGGVIRNMQFNEHFVFNLFFLILSIIGIYMSHKQKKGGPVAASDF
jgi:putative oxidoreductase